MVKLAVPASTVQVVSIVMLVMIYWAATGVRQALHVQAKLAKNFSASRPFQSASFSTPPRVTYVRPQARFKAVAGVPRRQGSGKTYAVRERFMGKSRSCA